MMSEVIQGDCVEELKKLSSDTFDAVVTDPPYGFRFMGKEWDYDVPKKELWAECLRVLKPGGYLLSFAGTRTQHRMAVNIEDAGFEIRDIIAWVYGQGFPKSHNIGKSVDKLLGNEREVVGDIIYSDGSKSRKTAQSFQAGGTGEIMGDTKATKGTSEWEGWGTALKPALEPITVARKPLERGLSVAKNCLKWGTGGINIDESRVGTTGARNNGSKAREDGYAKNDIYGKYKPTEKKDYGMGRFPANLIHDGSEEVRECFPETAPSKSKKHAGNPATTKFAQVKTSARITAYDDNGGNASRFFYCAKASKAERNKGCEELEEKPRSEINKMMGEAGNFKTGSGNDRTTKFTNNHPTVKPLALMEYLVRLVTKKGALVLDPFAGSGTTLVACKKLGRRYVGIEREEEYVGIARARLSSVKDVQSSVEEYDSE